MTQKLKSIVALQGSMKCTHCEGLFAGSYKQAYRFKYEKSNIYCSAICRFAALKKRFGIPRGPCPQCGEMFSSNNPKKIFCSMRCYTASPQFKAMGAANRASTPEKRAKIAAALRTGETAPCLECAGEIYVKRSQRGRKKFCCKVCYRSYMAKRFDRWIANPEGLALPQCYDEFLDRAELPCIIEGCDWLGRHLSVHVNQSHGVRAEEFKRAAGFNLSTGLVCRPLAELLQQRPNQGVAVPGLFPAPPQRTSDYVRYRSIEAGEHAAKARALAGAGPTRTCKGCGARFVQSTPFGRALYCTPICRDSAYSAERRVVSNPVL